MDDRMTVEERAARQGEIRVRLQEINAEYSGAELPEESRTEWDSLTEELEQHERAIQEATERRSQLEAILGQGDGTRHVERRGARDVMIAPRKPDNIWDIAEIRQRASSAEQIPALMRDNAMRAVEQARYPSTIARESAQAQAERALNEVDDNQGTLAKRFLTTGSPTYDRAFGKAIMARSTGGLTAEEQRAMSRPALSVVKSMSSTRAMSRRGWCGRYVVRCRESRSTLERPMVISWRCGPHQPRCRGLPRDRYEKPDSAAERDGQ